MARGFEDADARALRADQRPGDVEAALGQQLVQVVARHPARDVGIRRADAVRVTVAQVAQAGVDLAAPAALGDDPLELLVARLADPHAQAVVGHDVELDHVVDGLSAHDRVGAAGVVAEHPAERAVLVGCGIRRVRQVVRLGGVTELVADHAGLHPRALTLRVELEDPGHELRVVEDDRDVDALPRRAGAAAARQNRRAVAAAGGHRGDDVVGVARDHDADRDVAVDREVVRVQPATTGVEAHLAAHVPAQVALHRDHVDVGWPRHRSAPPRLADGRLALVHGHGFSDPISPSEAATKQVQLTLRRNPEPDQPTSGLRVTFGARAWATR